MTTFQCFQCYFMQGWFKCGGVEICKTRFSMGMSKQNARMNQDSISLGGPAVAEFVADIFVSLRGLPYQVCLKSLLRKCDVGHWTEVCC